MLLLISLDYIYFEYVLCFPVYNVDYTIIFLDYSNLNTISCNVDNVHEIQYILYLDYILYPI